MKRIMIFGAGGLIGQYLIDELIEKGYSLFCVEHNNRHTEKYKKLGILNDVVDISCAKDFKKLPTSGIDVVIFLAGVLPANMEGYHPEMYFQVNTLGALNILQYCAKIGVKQILYTQSHSDVAGLWGKKTISPYDKPVLTYNNDHTVYVISKLAAASLIEQYYHTHGISYCIFRCPNIYAYHKDRYYYRDGKKVRISYRYFIDRAIKSEPLELWGKYESKRDVVYIKDLTQMMRKAIDKQIDRAIYNVSNGVSISLKEQIEDIIEIFSPKENKSKIIYRPDIDIPDINYSYDIQNAVDDLGYKPKYFHKEMLIDMKKIMQKLAGLSKI